MICSGADGCRCVVRFDERCVGVVVARCIFSLLELREYALIGGEQAFGRADIERQRVWCRRFRREVRESYRQTEFAACRREDDAMSFGVRRRDEADELKLMAVQRVAWVSDLDSLARCKTLFDRGSYSGGVCPPRRCP